MAWQLTDPWSHLHTAFPAQPSPTVHHASLHAASSVIIGLEVLQHAWKEEWKSQANVQLGLG